MIHYRCRGCQAKLETPDENGRAEEKCPACGTPNRVPMSKAQRDEEQAERKAEKETAREARREGAMVTYKCPDCGTGLESPSSMAGQEDTCPVCNGLSVVPRRRAHRRAVIACVLGVFALSACTVVYIAMQRGDQVAQSDGFSQTDGIPPAVEPSATSSSSPKAAPPPVLPSAGATPKLANLPPGDTAPSRTPSELTATRPAARPTPTVTRAPVSPPPRSEFAKAHAAFAAAKRALKRTPALKSFVVLARGDANTYEIAITLGPYFQETRAILRTTITEYKSTGNASLPLRNTGTLKLKNKQGFPIEVVAFEEIPITAAECQAQMKRATESFQNAQSQMLQAVHAGRVGQGDARDLIELFASWESGAFGGLRINDRARSDVQNGLVRLGTDAVPELVRVLDRGYSGDDPLAKARYWACVTTLASLGKTASTAIPALNRARTRDGAKPSPMRNPTSGRTDVPRGVVYAWAISCIENDAWAALYRAVEAKDQGMLSATIQRIENNQMRLPEAWHSMLSLRSEAGDSLLHVAARDNNQAAVVTLCDLGAPVDIRDAHELMPIHYAIRGGFWPIAACLRKHVELEYREVHEFTQKVSAGDVAGIKAMLESNPHLVKPSSQRWPLHSAAQRGHADVVRLLLDYGADPSIKDRSRRTAIQVASQWRKANIVEMLRGPRGAKKAPVARPVKEESQRSPAEKAGAKLKLATSYISAGLKEKAREILRSIVQEYPDTPQAKEAEELLDRLQ